MTTYLEAVVNHDPSALPMTRNVKYTENGVRLAIGDGLWQTASKLPIYRVDVIDEQRAIGRPDRPNRRGWQRQWYGVRLKVEPDRKVSEIEVLVNRSLTGAGGGGSPGAAAAATRLATEPHPLMMQLIPESRRSTRTELAEAWAIRTSPASTQARRARAAFRFRSEVPAARERHDAGEQSRRAEKGSMHVDGLQDAVRHRLLSRSSPTSANAASRWWIA